MRSTSHNLGLSLTRPAEISQAELAHFMRDGFVTLRTPEEVNSALIAAFDAGSAFFSVDASEKKRNRLPQDLGYRARGHEYSQSPARPDEVESFTTTYRIEQSHFDQLSSKGAELNRAMLRLFNLLEAFAEATAIGVAKAVSGRDLSERIQRGFHLASLIQLNFSRPADTAVPYINELHDDGCLLTITSVTGPGLELRKSDGSFLPVTPSGDALLMMSGEIFWLLSGGLMRPVHHRVRSDTGMTERMSLLFFADLYPTLCEPWIVTNTNEGVDIGERVLKNSTKFGLAEWIIDATNSA